MAAVAGWSTLQLAEFVAAVAAAPDEESAVRCAVESATGAVEAEVGAFVHDGRLITAIGFPTGSAPAAELVALAAGEQVELDIPGVPHFQTMVAPVEGEQLGALVIVRSGEDGFSAEETGLLGAMGRSLSLTLSFLQLLATERSLRAASELHAAETRRNERLRAMHVAVTRTLAEVPGEEDAYRAILETIGDTLGWALGEIWLVNPEGDCLRRAHTWSGPGVERSGLKAFLRPKAFARGDGLPGQVWERRSVLIPDMADAGQMRRAEAAAAGLRWGMGIPLVNGPETIGVMTLFAPDEVDPGEQLLAIMTAIGSQVGQSMGRRQAERAVRESERNFRVLFMSHPHPMWLWDEETLMFLAVNDAAVTKYGYSREEFLAMRITDIRAKDEAPRLLHHVRHLLRDGPAGVWKHQLKDGRVIEAEVTANRQRFQGRPAILVLSQDVTERRLLERELEHQAFHDRLTGLPNRALFRDRAEQAIARAARNNRGCAVLLLDVDDFKTVNDRRGHEAGDQLLVGMARRLVQSVRPGDSIARLGGDEFAVLLEGADARDAADVARRIIHSLGMPFTVQSADVYSGASVGIAVSDGDRSSTPEELLRKADIAMYAAKAAGKGSWRAFDSEMNSAVSRSMELRESLRRVVSDGSLVIHYQPVVELSTGLPVGLEALVRWRHPEHGLLGPSEFVHLAEDTGVIVGIGRFVLEQSARQLVAWDEKFPGLDLSVNLSLRELQEDDFCDSVLGLLQATGLDPHRLIMEITESMIMNDRDMVVAKLEQLREHGVRIAIDDFGTGYSSLTYLRHLPVDVVKIDRAFVAGVATDTEDRSLTLAIVRLLGTLDVLTVAEGIERPEQLDYVRAMGCDHGQGYLFSQPLAAPELEKHITSRLGSGPDTDWDGSERRARRRVAASTR